MGSDPRACGEQFTLGVLLGGMGNGINNLREPQLREVAAIHRKAFPARASRSVAVER